MLQLTPALSPTAHLQRILLAAALCQRRPQLQRNYCRAQLPHCRLHRRHGLRRARGGLRAGDLQQRDWFAAQAALLVQVRCVRKGLCGLPLLWRADGNSTS